MHTMEVI